MKKLFLFMCVLSVLFCTSCKNNNESKPNTTDSSDKFAGKSGKYTCVLETKTQTFSFKGTYNITYIDGYVTKTYTREVMNLSDSDSLDAYEETLKKEYSVYDSIDNYEYSISKSDGKIINNTFIDYENIDLVKLSEISNEEVTHDDLKMSMVLASYKVMGAKCSEE